MVAERVVENRPIFARSLAATLVPVLLISLPKEMFMNVDAVADRVRAEFVEMPGLSLTVRQASRLFGLDQDVCRLVVDRLVRSDLLSWSSAGAVARGDR